MRKLIALVLALAALWLVGCETTTTSGGTEIDTEAFFPNEKDNYWYYSITDDDEIVDYMTMTVSNEPEELLAAGEQLLRLNYDSDDSDVYYFYEMVDDDTDGLQFLSYASYDNYAVDEIDIFDDNPRNFLIWDEYGMSVGDSWSCWEASGLTPELWGYDSDYWESVAFDLDADVVEKVSVTYDGESLTAYVIEYTGTITLDPVGDGDPTSAPWQEDIWFAPEFGIVMIQEYQMVDFNLEEAEVLELVDTNVPVPGD